MWAPKVGQLIHLFFSGDAFKDFNSYIIEEDEQFLYVQIPLPSNKEGKSMPDVGLNYWVEFTSSQGNLCRFESPLEAIHSGVNTVWRIQRPEASALIREQRREYVRVPADLPVRLELNKDSNTRQVDVYSRDVSGGGMAVLVHHRAAIQTGSTLLARFTLPNNGFAVEVKCFVVRVGEPNDRGFCVISLEFLNIKESIRQRIIQYTFWRQRALV